MRDQIDKYVVKLARLRGWHDSMNKHEQSIWLIVLLPLGMTATVSILAHSSNEASGHGALPRLDIGLPNLDGPQLETCSQSQSATQWLEEGAEVILKD